MKIEYYSLEGVPDNNTDLVQDHFGRCRCGCDLVFLQKRTVIKIFEEFLREYRAIPFEVEFLSFKFKGNECDLMTIVVKFHHKGEFHSNMELQQKGFGRNEDGFFLELETIERVLNPFIEKYRYLPIAHNVQLQKSKDNMAPLGKWQEWAVIVEIQQTGTIHLADLK